MGKMEGRGWSVFLQHEHQPSGVQENNTVHNKVEWGRLRQLGKQISVRVPLHTLESLPYTLSSYPSWLSPDPRPGLGVLWASTFYRN